MINVMHFLTVINLVLLKVINLQRSRCTRQVQCGRTFYNEKLTLIPFVYPHTGPGSKN